jgi:hypothetical protein
MRLKTRTVRERLTSKDMVDAERCSTRPLPNRAEQASCLHRNGFGKLLLSIRLRYLEGLGRRRLARWHNCLALISAGGFGAAVC